MGSDIDLDLLAASLRASAAETGSFVESLAAKLEEALPARVSIDRRRAGMFGPKQVAAIAVQTGDRKLELRVRSAGPEATVARLSGGIVLKRETLEFDDWLAALGEVLADEARRSEATRQALERLLIGE